MPQWLIDLLKGGANIGLVEKGIRETQDVGSQSQQSFNQLSNQFRTDLAFKPYTITSGTGSMQATAGGASSTLSPEMQRMSQELQRGASTFYDRLLPDIGTRAADLTAQMEAAMAPQRERDYLGMEQRLFGQGRLGLRTAEYGGSPEQLAFAKAVEEQRAMNALAGRQQAMQEQMQNYNIGTGLFGTSFVPQQQNLAAIQLLTPYAELANRMQQQQAVTGAELASAGLQARTQSEQYANALRLAQLQMLSNTLFGSQQGGGSGLLSSLAGGLSSLFNRG